MIKLMANYSKCLDLPSYSSHQLSVSCETEITNVSGVAAGSARARKFQTTRPTSPFSFPLVIYAG